MLHFVVIPYNMKCCNISLWINFNRNAHDSKLTCHYSYLSIEFRKNVRRFWTRNYARVPWGTPDPLQKSNSSGSSHFGPTPWGLWSACVCCCSKQTLTERWHLFNFQWKLLLNFDRWGDSASLCCEKGHVGVGSVRSRAEGSVIKSNGAEICDRIWRWRDEGLFRIITLGERLFCEV